jgi:FkbM family methyltransferase
MKTERGLFQTIKTFFRLTVGKKLGELPIFKKISFYYRLASFQGNKMYVNPRDKVITPSILKNGVWEPDETRLFKRVIKKGMIVVDLGANVGWYTLIAAKLVGNNGKVYSFEPDPDNCALLRKNVQINGYENVIVEQKAALDHGRIVKLFLNVDNLGDHRIYDCHDRRKWTFTEGIVLDDYFDDNHKKIDVIKMDIQGAEMAALVGMDKIIRANDKLKMFIEFSPFLIKRSGFSPEAFLNRIAKYGFKIHVISVQNKKSVDEIMDLFNDKPLDHGVDLFLERIDRSRSQLFGVYHASFSRLIDVVLKA